MTKPSASRRHRAVEHDSYRSPFEHDRDRVLYSSAFRRLAGVAQVAAVHEQRVLHNRLTHSLKVAQLGRRLVQYLVSDTRTSLKAEAKRSGLNMDVVETAGLVHDIGHPPFGHIAETVLDKKMRAVKDLEGFEGNAQSFRIVTKLARRWTGHPGLDLTAATLDAVLKYPRPRPAGGNPFTEPSWTDRGFGSKWGTYRTELEDFRHARPGERGERRSANAVLMDWADDITYATHDIEDYFRAGLIPLHNLEDDLQRIIKHGTQRLAHLPDFNQTQFTTQLKKIVADFGDGLDSLCWDTRANRAAMNKITTTNLTECVDAVEAIAEPPYVRVGETQQYLVEALKELTWFYVIDRPPLAILQEGQKRIIASLYDQLFECLHQSPKSPRLPIQLRVLYKDIKADRENVEVFQGNKDARCSRAVVDYICLLTEAQAVDLGERLSGHSRSSMFGTWFN